MQEVSESPRWLSDLRSQIRNRAERSPLGSIPNQDHTPSMRRNAHQVELTSVFFFFLSSPTAKQHILELERLVNPVGSL